MHADDGPLADLVQLGDGQGGGVGGEDGAFLGHFVHFLEQGALDLGIFGGSFDDQISVSDEVFLHAGLDAAEDGVHFFLSHLALGNALGHAGGNFADTLVSQFLGDIGGEDLVLIASLSKSMGDTGTHSAGADDANLHVFSSCFVCFLY